MTSTIVVMESDEEILSTRDVMLRAVRAVAGYRVVEMLYCGRILVVDDLVTDASVRARGHGKALLTWLKDEGKRQGCGQVHLDSRVQREDAHRFYFREGFAITCFHFCASV